MKRTATNLWVDLVSLMVMLALAATGGVLYFVLPPGTGHSRTLFGLHRHDYGQIHAYLAVAAILLLALHLLLHWAWACCVAARALGVRAPARAQRTRWGVAFLLGIVILLAGGLWWASGKVQPSPRPRPGDSA